MPGKTRCVMHPVLARTRIVKSHERAHKTARWKRIRKQVLRRDGHMCVLCDATEDLVVDVIGGAYDRMWELDALRTLCRACSGREDGGRRYREQEPPSPPEAQVRRSYIA